MLKRQTLLRKIPEKQQSCFGSAAREGIGGSYSMLDKILLDTKVRVKKPEPK